MANGFKIGDTVQLKSGGPIMTVKALESDVWCTWFDGSNLKDGKFPAATLAPYSPNLGGGRAITEEDF